MVQADEILRLCAVHISPTKVDDSENQLSISSTPTMFQAIVDYLNSSPLNADGTPVYVSYGSFFVHKIDY